MTTTPTRVRRLARKMELRGLTYPRGRLLYDELAKTGDQDLNNPVLLEIHKRQGRTPHWAIWAGWVK